MAPLAGHVGGGADFREGAPPNKTLHLTPRLRLGAVDFHRSKDALVAWGFQELLIRREVLTGSGHMRLAVRVTLMLVGAIMVLIGMHYVISGTQHGDPATPGHELDTGAGAVLVAAGSLLQLWPALTFVGESWRSGPRWRLRRGSLSAVALFVGLGIVVVGAVYFADGAQKGASGGRGVDSVSGEMDPAFDGQPGEAGDATDVWIGSALAVGGLLIQLALAVAGPRRAQGDDGNFRTTGSSRPSLRWGG